MNDAIAKVKKQLIEKVQSSTNILVTVSKNPDVDALSAALGLTAVLNKLEKHATAIFSGAIPPAISFLEPDKVFENSADSLRDFIIALDKEKADHLRYKVEGDLVKIFITPYRTTISGDDLQFSQGEFNVELVLALGVSSQDDLDTALSAHQIRDDITVITFTFGQQTSKLGSIDWHNDSASCLCEMVAGLAETSKDEEPLLDKQISTALLTGIVAATDRFSNEKTTAQVMSVSAELMAAGADQQLIAAKLQEGHAIDALPTRTGKPKQDTVAAPVSTLSKSSDDGEITIDHGTDGKVPSINEILSLHSTQSNEEESTLPSSLTAPVAFATETAVADVESTLPVAAEPTIGGTLNATTSQAAEDAARDIADDQNKTILSHSYLGGDEPDNMAMNGVAEGSEEAKPVDIFNFPPIGEAGGPTEGVDSTLPSVEQTNYSLSAPTVEQAASPNIQETSAMPAMPVEGLPLPPPVPDFSSTLPPPVPQTMPDLGVVAPPPVPETPVITASEPESTLPPAPAVDDPSKFKIPGQ